MAQFPFGNDPAKIEKYLAFWKRDDVTRPLVGFSFVGWFPMNEFAVCQNWASSDYLTLDMVEPQNFMDDHVRLAREGEIIDDDMIHGRNRGPQTHCRHVAPPSCASGVG